MGNRIDQLQEDAMALLNGRSCNEDRLRSISGITKLADLARKAEARADHEARKARWIASMVSAGTSTEWGVIHKSGQVAVLFTGVNPHVVVADDAYEWEISLWLDAAEIVVGIKEGADDE